MLYYWLKQSHVISVQLSFALPTPCTRALAFAAAILTFLFLFSVAWYRNPWGILVFVVS